MAEIELPNPEELEEKSRNSFGKKVALFTAIYAVILAICALGGNNSMKEMLLAQQEASNQWAYYQAKNIREYLYKIEKDRLETQIVERGNTMKSAALKHYKAEIQKVSAEEVRLSKDKQAILLEAKKQEHERDVNRAKDPYFDFGEALLQIAIVMSSVAIIAGSRHVFFFSIGAAVLGSLITLNGFLLLIRVPFLH
jgi:seryl-tRNA synthetase